MVEIQIFLEGFFATVAEFAGDFVSSMQAFFQSVGTGIRDILSGIGA